MLAMNLSAGQAGLAACADEDENMIVDTKAAANPTVTAANRILLPKIARNFDFLSVLIIGSL